jgi:hypothetical protein
VYSRDEPHPPTPSGACGEGEKEVGVSVKGVE